MSGESLLSKFKIEYEYDEDYIDILAMLKSLRIKRTLEERKKTATSP